MGRVLFTNSVVGELNEYLQGVSVDMRFLLVDKCTKRFCLPLLQGVELLEQNIIEIDCGEDAKSLQTVQQVWARLVNNGARRDSVLINLGGGVVTDLGGFAAACYKRGIKCVNIPTTLLSQVDASVGGKTGVNFMDFKNEIGVFSIPELVIIDNAFLKTLPYDEVISGYAEMIKHAMLCSYESLDKIMQVDLNCVAQPEFLQILRESVAVKERVVEEDPTEKGVRKALNLGHTFGHAYESYAINKGETWYHGHSVAMGLIGAIEMSVMKCGFNRELADTIINYIKGIYPKYPANPTPEELYALMLHDKKNDGNGVNFTLIKEPGQFMINSHCSKQEILDVLKIMQL